MKISNCFGLFSNFYNRIVLYFVKHKTTIRPFGRFEFETPVQNGAKAALEVFVKLTHNHRGCHYRYSN